MINVDKNPAYPKAVGRLKKRSTLLPDCERRPVKHLNNLIEQDHRFIKRRVNPGMGLCSFDTAWRTIQGYEAMHQLRKEQVHGTTKGDIRSQVRFVSAAFGLAAQAKFRPDPVLTHLRSSSLRLLQENPRLFSALQRREH